MFLFIYIDNDIGRSRSKSGPGTIKMLTAASSPLRLGTKTGYEIPGFLIISFNTSALSAICGTHFGDTKLKIKHTTLYNCTCSQSMV